MDRNHRRLIIILLAGILLVMLAGRDAALGLIGNGFWIALAVVALALIVWTIIAFVSFIRREAKLYREEVGRVRRDGRPWLYSFIAWPGILGNFAVGGIALLHFSKNECLNFCDDCLEQVPFWWFPISLLLLSMPVMVVEKLILKWRKPSPSAVSDG